MSALSKRGEASVLLEFSATSIAKARKAWRLARGSSDVATLRAAFRASLLAARVTRSAAAAWERDPRGRKLAAQAKRLDASSDELLKRLASAIEAEESTAPTQ